jgi:hypothetical protein
MARHSDLVPSGNPGVSLRIGLSFLIALLSCWTTAWAAEPASAPAIQAGEVSLHGKVSGAYDNAEFLMEDGGKHYAVSIGPEFWELGIRRGDEVAVVGTKKANAPFQNEIVARTAQIVNRPSKKESPLRVRSSMYLRENGKVGEVVVLRGEITGYEDVRMELTDASGRILVDLNSLELREKFHSGQEVVVIGVLAGSKSLPIKSVNPILIRSSDDFRREGEPDTAEKIADVLKRRPVGELVRVRGWVSLFIGSEEGHLLNDGDAHLIIRPSERYLSLDPQAGAEVEVVGVFGYETHKEKEIGALNEARIDSLAAVANQESGTP